VAGQLHGGIAQGVGQALWEGAVYGEDGQLLSGSMLDYALPKASRLPSFELEQTVTPSPDNPLGVKGIGEAGTIASTAAVVNAVVDALSPLGIHHVDMPLTAQTVWRAMEVAKGSRQTTGGHRMNGGPRTNGGRPTNGAQPAKGGEA
jgi:carbon-monoxide dehydrogenase large subunit